MQGSPQGGYSYEAEDVIDDIRSISKSLSDARLASKGDVRSTMKDLGDRGRTQGTSVRVGVGSCVGDAKQ
ncbi:unnamed protein product, partial [Ilex paraguariensis]